MWFMFIIFWASIYLYLMIRLDFIHRWVINEINKVYEFKVDALINNKMELMEYYEKQYDAIPSYGILLFKFWIPLEKYSIKKVTHSEYLQWKKKFITNQGRENQISNNVLKFEKKEK